MSACKSVMGAVFECRNRKSTYGRVDQQALRHYIELDEWVLCMCISFVSLFSLTLSLSQLNTPHSMQFPRIIDN